MLKNLLLPEVQKFIRDHEQDDERELILRHKEISGVTSAVIADQISGRRKAKDKLPIYYSTPDILYPPGVNLEQASSEQTAKFKLSLISLSQMQSLGQGVDLTGGFGVDTFFLSRLFSIFHYVESNTGLLEIARHNHTLLGAGNIQHHSIAAESFLDQLVDVVDFIFIDPSRRNENKKVFTFSHSEPDILSFLGRIFEKTEHLLIKASPLLDIKLGLRELSFVKKVFVVSVENEVKELLFLCEKGFAGEPFIEAINILKNQAVVTFSFLFSEENVLSIPFADPLTYLYEPNASILKAGAFKTISKRFDISKVQTSTHFYTSDSLVNDFPGRVFKVEGFVKPDPKKMGSFFPEGKANVITRNYPLSVSELKKKTGLKDGGEKFLIGFSGVKEKFLCVAERIR